MCGIAGIALNHNCVLPDIEQRLLRMRTAMTHRGPDDAGIYIAPDGRAGLVSCRLAIRDLSPTGHMPMGTADGTTWMTFNGEIYNDDELRFELSQTGYSFLSEGDTEVLLCGYRAWDTQVVLRLRGMFAFAVLDVHTFTRWDANPAAQASAATRQRASRLFLARDRLGIKPLYYAHTPQAFVFASELKALLASGLVSRTIDPTALVAFLLMGSVPCPLTIYRDVHALEPAHTLDLTIGMGPGSAEIRRYWDFPGDPLAPAAGVDVVEELQKALGDAVRSHLVSDVPLGAFLSGGLDSSSIVALMRAATNTPIRTCSMIFDEAAYNEGSFARAVADAVGAEHYERLVTASDVRGELERMLWAMDQPTHDAINTYFVAQTARQAGLTVALSGLGGDELFGGYDKTFRDVPRLSRIVELLRYLPGSALLARTALSRLPLHRRWAKVADALAYPPSLAGAYLACRGLFSPGEVQALVTPEIWHTAMEAFDPIRHIAERADSRGQGSGVRGQASDRQGGWGQSRSAKLAWVRRAELATYTHHQLLRDTDAMSMAHSLEVRVPLLDHWLIERVLRLPDALKLNDGHQPKPLLAQAMYERLPPLVRERREKRGFTFPFDIWLRGPLRGDCEQWLHTPSNLDGMLRPEAAGQVWQAYLQGTIHWARPWALAILRGWSALER